MYDNYPMYGQPEAPDAEAGVPDPIHDLSLPNVRKLVLGGAIASITNGLPLTEEARKVVLEDQPDLAKQYGIVSDNSETIPVTGLSGAEYQAWLERSQKSGVVGNEGEHHSGTAGQTIIKNDYQGDLGGGTPRNALEVPGIIHR